jgi:hypothetical protein
VRGATEMCSSENSDGRQFRAPLREVEQPDDVLGPSGDRQDVDGGPLCQSACVEGPVPAQLIELVDAAIVAVDAADTEVARAQLQALAEAVRALRHGCGRDGV